MNKKDTIQTGIIGNASMEEDGTIIMDLEFNPNRAGPGGTGRLIYKTYDPGYWEVLARLGNLTRERRQVILDDWPVD